MALRLTAALAIVALAATLAVWAAFFRPGHGAATAPEQATAGSSFARALPPAVLLAAINAVRAEHGLRPLRLSTALTRPARQHSVEMGERGYFAHRSADGKPFWKRIRRFYKARGFDRWTVGENLAWHTTPMAPTEVISDWLASPPHRKNLLGRGWREVGISSAVVPNAPGVFGGLEVAIVTVDFGVRRR